MSKNTVASARSETDVTGRESWKVAKNLKKASTSFSCCAYSEDIMGSLSYVAKSAYYVNFGHVNAPWPLPLIGPISLFFYVIRGLGLALMKAFELIQRNYMNLMHEPEGYPFICNAISLSNLQPSFLVFIIHCLAFSQTGQLSGLQISKA